MESQIQGQVCHLIGSLLPNDSETSKFLQIYFLDNSDQVKSRMTISNNFELKPTLMHCVQETLYNYNKYIRELKSAYQYARQQNLQNYSMTILEYMRPQGEHERRYNAPTCKEVRDKETVLLYLTCLYEPVSQLVLNKGIIL